MNDVVADSAWPIPLDDPYPSLAAMRTESPVHYLPSIGSYLVVAQAEAKMILGDPEWSSDPRANPRFVERLGSASASGDLFSKSVLFSDAADHRRLRRALGSYLSPSAVEQLRPRIKSIVSAAFSDVDDSKEFEVMKSLAYPVALAVICELLDVGGDAARVVRSETPKMLAMLDPLAESDAIEDGAAAAFGMLLELVPVIVDRQSNPGEDLISALTTEAPRHQRLASDETIMMALLLLAAGHETTASLIGNTIICLRDYPEQARWLRQHPERLGTAVDEFLRFESPVQLVARVAKSGVVLGNTSIEPGGQVLVSLGAVNRDPATYSDPERLNLKRNGPCQMAFGHGVHFCAGATLARAESEEVLAALLALDPPIEERNIDLGRGASPTFRRIESLTIRAV